MTLAWQDGRLTAEAEAHIPITDRGFLLGDGLFETMAVRRGRVFDLGAHLNRLASGLDVLNLRGAVDLAWLHAEIDRYLGAAKIDSAVLRLTVTRGSGPRGLLPPPSPRPKLLMALSAMPALREEPLSLHVSALTRRNEFSPLARIKALPYLDNVLALQEARAHGADDALLLNTRGNIACSSIANIFIVREGRLETPPASAGALPGTMRALVLTLASELRLAAVERILDVADLAAADEVFLTNSVSRIAPVTQCGGKPVGRGAGGAVERLRGLIAAKFDAG
ncbi:MAG: aminotransferase class IV family protein [Methylocapsa sp.]|nr:aminotransferase class IV family protein [Methylocapsa sp.]